MFPHLFSMRLMSNNCILWQKQSKELLSFFRMPWNVIKIHLLAHRYNIPPVHSVRSNKKAGAWASWIGRDLSCSRRGEAMLCLAFLFPPTWGMWPVFSLTPIRKWLCYSTLPVNTNETYPWKREHQHGLSTQMTEVIPASKSTAIVILQNTIEKANMQE